MLRNKGPELLLPDLLAVTLAECRKPRPFRGERTEVHLLGVHRRRRAGKGVIRMLPVNWTGKLLRPVHVPVLFRHGDEGLLARRPIGAGHKDVSIRGDW